mmetsp:Transcript_23357/g.21245  ORF Transcript_23357/g.21245 Transcript_23357/m.21245 type:complete len:1408 (+) Transcript_23357:45-4268(+)
MSSILNLTAIKGDAFLSDTKPIKYYGQNINKFSSNYVINKEIEIPQLRLLLVSQAKLEAIPSNCHTLITSAKSLICYTTTTKKSLMRLINTKNGEKKILRGHNNNPISDMKFSSNDNHTIFCSCDSISNTNIILLKEDFDTQVLYEINKPSHLIRGSPINSFDWLLANNNQLSKVNALDLNIITVDAAATITDVAFTSNGRYVYALTKDQDNKSLISLYNNTVLTHEKTFDSTISHTVESITIVNNYLVTIVKTDSDLNYINSIVKVYYINEINNQVDLELKQEIAISLPYEAPNPLYSEDPSVPISRNYQITSLQAVDTFIVLSHMTSRFIACMILPSNHSSIPIQHITFLDLTMAPLSLSISTITGPDDTNDGSYDINYLEISCCQLNSSNTIINQYLTPIDNLYSRSDRSSNDYDGLLSSINDGIDSESDSEVTDERDKFNYDDNISTSATIASSNYKFTSVPEVSDKLDNKTNSLNDQSNGEITSTLIPSSETPVTASASNTTLGVLRSILGINWNNTSPSVVSISNHQINERIDRSLSMNRDENGVVIDNNSTIMASSISSGSISKLSNVSSNSSNTQPTSSIPTNTLANNQRFLTVPSVTSQPSMTVTNTTSSSISYDSLKVELGTISELDFETISSLGALESSGGTPRSERDLSGYLPSTRSISIYSGISQRDRLNTSISANDSTTESKADNTIDNNIVDHLVSNQVDTPTDITANPNEIVDNNINTISKIINSNEVIEKSNSPKNSSNKLTNILKNVLSISPKTEANDTRDVNDTIIFNNLITNQNSISDSKTDNVDLNIDSKLDVKLDNKIESKVDSKSEEKFDSKEDSNLDSKADNKSDSSVVDKIDSKANSKFDSKIVNSNDSIDFKLDSKLDRTIDSMINVPTSKSNDLPDFLKTNVPSKGQSILSMIKSNYKVDKPVVNPSDKETNNEKSIDKPIAKEIENLDKRVNLPVTKDNESKLLVLPKSKLVSTEKTVDEPVVKSLIDKIKPRSLLNETNNPSISTVIQPIAIESSSIKKTDSSKKIIPSSVTKLSKSSKVDSAIDKSNKISLPVVKIKSKNDLLDSKLTDELIEKSVDNLIDKSIDKSVDKTIDKAIDKAILKDVIKEIMKETFETTIVPSIERGINQMFNQVNQTLSESLSKYNQLIANTNSNTISDDKQIKVLQSSMEQVNKSLISIEKSLHQFDDKLSIISNDMKNLEKSQTELIIKSINQSNRYVDPEILLSEGRVTEALEAVVISPDISILINILNKIPLQSLNESPSIVQLSLVHRLVEDMSTTNPIEGWRQRMEWVKCLTISIIRSKNPSTPSNSRSLSRGNSLQLSNSNENSNNTYPLDLYKGTFELIEKLLQNTLVRLIEDTKVIVPENKQYEAQLSLLSSGLVSDIELLITLIKIKYL